MALSIGSEPDMTAVCRSPRMPWIAAVLVDVGFSGSVSWVEIANFDSSSLGLPSTEK